MTQEQEYVLGTHDEELTRLGLQHRVWRPRALDAWRRAGFTLGQTLLDVGCGPGYAALDLAEIVGPSGRVIAVDQSRRFLDHLAAESLRRGLANVKADQVNLDEADLPALSADGAWARWVFAFVKKPRELLLKISRSLRPGGMLVLHEYFDYSTWRLVPRSGEFEEFVQAVMQSWRANGGEPDIGLDLATWLEESGFQLRSLAPIIDVVPRTNFVWEWPTAFVRTNLRRLVELGYLTPDRALSMEKALEEHERSPRGLMITPGVLEIIAAKT